MSNDIELEFTPQNVEQVLNWGLNPIEAPHTHEEIACWCERFWNKYSDVECSKEIDAVMPVLADIENNWDSYIIADKNNRQMPLKWFRQWLQEIHV